MDYNICLKNQIQSKLQVIMKVQMYGVLQIIRLIVGVCIRTVIIQKQQRLLSTFSVVTISIFAVRVFQLQQMCRHQVGASDDTQHLVVFVDDAQMTQSQRAKHAIRSL